MCGWCATTNWCQMGVQAEPFYGDCPDWRYGTCATTPACRVFHTCDDCAAQPYCGWCDDTNECEWGGASGPVFPFDDCPNNWHFGDSCGGGGSSKKWVWILIVTLGAALLIGGALWLVLLRRGIHDITPAGPRKKEGYGTLPGDHPNDNV